MSLSIRTPTKKSLARVSSLGSSFASCFGASAPVSPRRVDADVSLAGQAGVSYRKLGFDEDEEEEEYIGATDQEEDASEDEHENALEGQRLEGPPRKLGSHSSSKEKAKQGLHCASEEGDESARERKGVLKLGKQLTMREKARMWMFYASETSNKGGCYESEEESDGYARERKDDENSRERKGAMQLDKQCSMREKSRMEVCYASEAPKKVGYAASEEEAEEYARERKGGKQCTVMREKEEKGVNIETGSPRRGPPLSRKASFGAKVREACVQVLETARRSSPHLSELFVGNQLLMQVTSSSFSARHAKNMAPSAGLVVTGDPSISVMSPPPHSTSSAFF
eukprot:c1883_g1_i2 orf=124-1143(+)